MKLLFAFLLVGGQIEAFDETDLALHAERAKAAQQQGDFRKAAGEWEAIAKLRPDVPEVYSNAGMMWHFAQDYPKAIPAFRQALRLKARQRLCLSGTPLQNHLGELWSLFDFLAPGFLGGQKSFSTAAPWCCRFFIPRLRST